MLKIIIFATLLFISGVLPAADLQVGHRLALKKDFIITKTDRTDYILLNDIEVFLKECKVYVLNGMGPGMNNPVINDNKDNIQFSMYRGAFAEYYPNTIKRYLAVGWKVEKIVESSKYTAFPKFYAGMIFIIESVDKNTICVIDRSGIRYQMILPKNIENTFTILD